MARIGWILFAVALVGWLRREAHWRRFTRNAKPRLDAIKAGLDEAAQKI